MQIESNVAAIPQIVAMIIMEMSTLVVTGYLISELDIRTNGHSVWKTPFVGTLLTYSVAMSIRNPIRIVMILDWSGYVTVGDEVTGLFDQVLMAVGFLAHVALLRMRSDVIIQNMHKSFIRPMKVTTILFTSSVALNILVSIIAVCTVYEGFVRLLIVMTTGLMVLFMAMIDVMCSIAFTSYLNFSKKSIGGGAFNFGTSNESMVTIASYGLASTVISLSGLFAFFMLFRKNTGEEEIWIGVFTTLMLHSGCAGWILMKTKLLQQTHVKRSSSAMGIVSAEVPSK
jgi:hypothetical protein